MTTILAVKNPLMMLADSLTNDGDMKRLTSQKLLKFIIPFDADSLLYEYQIPTSGGMPAIAGYSGESQSGMEFFYWCKNGLTVASRPHFSDQHGINALLLLQTGVLLRFDHQMFPFEIEQEYYAVGSGRDYALGALEAYIDWAINENIALPENRYSGAMKIACALDIYSSLPIHVLTLEA